MKKYNIVIAGGGFAGLYAALYIDAAFEDRNTIDYKITVIRSKAIGTIGVGESLAQGFIRELISFGIDGKKFFKESGATFKLMGKFTNWHKPDESFIHPLVSSDRIFKVNPSLLNWWNEDYYTYMLYNNLDMHCLTLADVLLEDNLLPMNDIDLIPFEKWFDRHPIEAFGINFDASKSVEVIEEFIETNTGIELIDDKIVDWNLNSDTGFVESLILENGQNIKGDFFIDSTGFARLFGNKIFKSEWVDAKDIKQNSVSLIKGGIKYKSESETIPIGTEITAMPEGWMFAIPLQHRIGSGYIHSSDISNIDDIRQQHINYWSNKGYKNLEPGPVLKWSPGYFKNPLQKNVLMLGLSEGFLDPLDSNALILTVTALKQFLYILNPLLSEPFTEFQYTTFNEWRQEAYEWTKDVIKLMCSPSNSKLASPFWKHYKNNNIFPKRFRDTYSMLKFLKISGAPILAPFGMSSVMLFARMYDLIDKNIVEKDYITKGENWNAIGKQFMKDINEFNLRLKDKCELTQNQWIEKNFK